MREPKLVISVNSEGIVTTGNKLFPKKNVSVKLERTNKNTDKEFFKSHQKKVLANKTYRETINKLQNEKRVLELNVRKNTARVIANSLNKVIINTTSE